MPRRGAPRTPRATKKALVLNDSPRTPEEARELLKSMQPRRNDNPEQREQIKVINWRNAKVLQGFLDFRWLFAIPNGGKRDGKAAAMAMLEGATSGVWDLLWPLRRTNWPGIWIEMKWGENDLSHNQRLFRVWVEQQGYLTRVCWSAEEAMTVLSDYYADKL